MARPYLIETYEGRQQAFNLKPDQYYGILAAGLTAHALEEPAPVLKIYVPQGQTWRRLSYEGATPQGAPGYLGSLKQAIQPREPAYKLRSQFEINISGYPQQLRRQGVTLPRYLFALEDELDPGLVWFFGADSFGFAEGLKEAYQRMGLHPANLVRGIWENGRPVWFDW